MTRFILAASLSALALTAGAHAQEGTFKLGAGYDRADFDGLEFDTLAVRGGYDFTNYLGIEGQANIGLGDEQITEGGVTADVNLDYMFGLYGVFRPIQNEQGSLFIRGGYSTAELEASVGGLSDSASENAWTYGVGGEYFFDGVNGVRADYTRFEFEDDGGDADVFGVSYVRRFGG